MANGIPAPGQPPLAPEHGLQWEGGVKAELLDKRLTATLAYYDIFKSNILAPVAGTPYSYPIGLAESRGVELDIAGRINDNWSLTASYAYDEARIRNGSAPNDFTGAAMNLNGNVLQDVPRHSGSLWLKYDASGELKGLTLGGGVVAVGERQGDNQNDFQLPGLCAHRRAHRLSAEAGDRSWREEPHISAQCKESREHDLLSEQLDLLQHLPRCAPDLPGLGARGVLRCTAPSGSSSIGG